MVGIASGKVARRNRLPIIGEPPTASSPTPRIIRCGPAIVAVHGCRDCCGQLSGQWLRRCRCYRRLATLLTDPRRRNRGLGYACRLQQARPRSDPGHHRRTPEANPRPASWITPAIRVRCDANCWKTGRDAGSSSARIRSPSLPRCCSIRACPPNGRGSRRCCCGSGWATWTRRGLLWRSPRSATPSRPSRSCTGISRRCPLARPRGPPTFVVTARDMTESGGGFRCAAR